MPPQAPARLWRFHKPAGLALNGPKPQSISKLGGKLPPVVAIGALEPDMEGLLLITSDAEAARLLELAAMGWIRRYKVETRAKVPDAKLETLRDGVAVGGVHFGPVEAAFEKNGKWLHMALREGKHREVKRMCDHLQLKPKRIMRLEFGPFELGDLKSGAVEDVPEEQWQSPLGGKFGTQDAHRRRKI
jgi:23S rRNA pseudouridine2605 synthase